MVLESSLEEQMCQLTLLAPFGFQLLAETFPEQELMFPEQELKSLEQELKSLEQEPKSLEQEPKSLEQELKSLEPGVMSREQGLMYLEKEAKSPELTMLQMRLDRLWWRRQ
jgi:septal ring factor EnvC (AmiA/AmiB activator)